MAFNHDTSWDLLTSTLAQQLPVQTAWQQFIDAHAQQYPKPYWDTLKAIDTAKEQADIVAWMNEVVTEEPAPPGISAIWIGLFKFADENDATPLLSMVGANAYDRDDADWATEPDYEPANRYVQLASLLHIDNTIKPHTADYEFLDWILPLAYAAFAFDEIARTQLDKTLFTREAGKLHLTVGHDSGDYINVSPIGE
ncbi:hypothetical protein [Paraflavitalea pollutisoli]|uniref:hypothetical protein n=1 Tax=Paraflavitalea pollutisoli TaxID=3034143 RepID=UPI0023ED58D1|nr:hypothetical protein [Paraflavitalea sp. H1-2-19X]